MADPQQRYREIYERHQAGETYKSIAKDLAISQSRAGQLARAWERVLRRGENPSNLVTLPRDYWDHLMQLGNGDWNLGIKLLITEKMHNGRPTTEVP